MASPALRRMSSSSDFRVPPLLSAPQKSPFRDEGNRLNAIQSLKSRKSPEPGPPQRLSMSGTCSRTSPGRVVDTDGKENRQRLISQKQPRSKRRASLPAATSSPIALTQATTEENESIKPQHLLHGVEVHNRVSILSIADPHCPFIAKPSRRLLTSERTDFVAVSNYNAEATKNKPLLPSGHAIQGHLSLSHVPKPSVRPHGSGDNGYQQERSIFPSVTDRHRKKSRNHHTSHLNDPIVETVAIRPDSGETFQILDPEDEQERLHVDMTADLSAIRKLVHAYSLYPPDQSVSCDEALEIERLTGYPLSNRSSQPSPQDKTSAVFLESRRLGGWSFLDKDSLKKMDEGRRSAVRLIEQITGCRMEKTARGICYIQSSSNHMVDSAEYERRYNIMLDEMTQVRSASWRKYFEGLVTNSTSTFVSMPGITPSSIQSDKKRTQDLMISGDVKVVDGTKQTANSYNEYTDDASRRQLSRTASTCQYPFVQVLPALHPDSDQLMQRELLLPLPSRDESSVDPDIARAENKLWASIDEALATYSREVLAIRKGRAREGDSTSSLSLESIE